jgi:hypothetical protein
VASLVGWREQDGGNEHTYELLILEDDGEEDTRVSLEDPRSSTGINAGCSVGDDVLARFNDMVGLRDRVRLHNPEDFPLMLFALTFFRASVRQNQRL